MPPSRLPRFLTWPLRYFPACRIVGAFPMTVPGCNVTYRHRTVALHLHGYSGEMWIGGHRYSLEPDDLTISPGGDFASRYALSGNGTHLCLHFVPPEGKVRGESVRLPLHLRLGPQTAAARERIWRIIDHARQSGGKVESPPGMAASAALQELLLWLHLQAGRNATPGRNSQAEAALVKLEAAIENSLARPQLIADLAAGVGLSADYVARLFARRYGMRLQHYLLLRRIELARHLLVASDSLVLEIGAQVGLPDPQYFNKQFRRVTGLSPLAYRRKAHGKKPAFLRAGGR